MPRTSGTKPYRAALTATAGGDRGGSGVETMARASTNRDSRKDVPEPDHKRDQIERNLKRVYDETLNEPLPDRLAELLEQLRKKGGK